MLGMVRQEVSSHLYEEALPADVQDIFAQVSHQLRTPFHGLMSSVELLRASGASLDAAEQDEITESAFLCGPSLLPILDDVLDIAKDRSNTELARRCFAAASPINIAMASMKVFAAMNQVNLATAISAGSTRYSNSTTNTLTGQDRDIAGLHEVVGDERRINSIVHSLVNNDIKFTPSGGKVEVSLLVFDSLRKATD